jgi:hypothetical protein
MRVRDAADVIGATSATRADAIRCGIRLTTLMISIGLILPSMAPTKSIPRST